MMVIAKIWPRGRQKRRSTGARVLPLLALMLALILSVGQPALAVETGRPVSVLQGAFLAAPPRGYCVRPKASTQSAQSAVVLMGRCESAEASAPALISVSVGDAGSSAVLKKGVKALSDYFLSPQGRAAMARDGKASSLRVRKTILADGVLILRVEDRSVGAYWRAVLGLKGRLVTVSVLGPEGGTIPEAEGRRLLDQAVAALEKNNRGP